MLLVFPDTLEFQKNCLTFFFLSCRRDIYSLQYIGSGELTEKQDYPVDEGDRLLVVVKHPNLVPSDQN